MLSRPGILSNADTSTLFAEVISRGIPTQEQLICRLPQIEFCAFLYYRVVSLSHICHTYLADWGMSFSRATHSLSQYLWQLFSLQNECILSIPSRFLLITLPTFLQVTERQRLLIRNSAIESKDN